MAFSNPTPNPETPSLHYDLGHFEGFNFRSQSAIDHHLDAEAVVQWDHDRDGEAEFWPAGDHPEVLLLFKHRSSVTAAELLDLDRLLVELGGDARPHFLQIHFAVNVCGADLASLSAEAVEDHGLQVFIGTSFLDVRRDAAYELFELCFPDEYRVWNHSLCDGLIFDTDRFLDSPGFWVEEVTLGDEVAVLVASR